MKYYGPISYGITGTVVLAGIGGGFLLPCASYIYFSWSRYTSTDEEVYDVDLFG
jgi:hypothetical protein